MGVAVKELVGGVGEKDEFCDDQAILAKLGYKQVLYRTW
jgi:hypothetical protein